MDTMTFIRENWKNTARLCRESHDGNIGLPYPYFVPSITGGFNNLFYWDSYFTAQGMLRHGQEALVKSTVDDMLYLIDRYGYMPNGNAKVLMGRSQPPFLSELVRQLYGIYQDPVWLRTAYCILQKEHDFWMKKRQLPCGLNRYGFDDLSPDGIAMGLDVAKRLPGVDFSGKTDAQIAENVMADAESGWDFSPRCMGHQTDCAYVDLNAILYGMENNLTFFAQELGEVAEADKWAQAAQRRKKLMRQMLFDGEGYRDRDMTTGTFSPIFSVASFYPLWAVSRQKRRLQAPWRSCRGWNTISDWQPANRGRAHPRSSGITPTAGHRCTSLRYMVCCGMAIVRKQSALHASISMRLTARLPRPAHCGKSTT